MNGYTLTRNWYNYKFEHPSKVRHVHSDLYFYIIDLWNRLGQKKEFGLPTMITMESVGIGSYNTYKKTLNDLIDFGFIKLIQESKNQHISKIISISALSKNDKATDKALDKAHTKADDKATDKPTDTIIEQRNKGTIKQKNKGTKHAPKKNIPEFEEFKNYALEKKEDVCLNALKLKHESWKENNWKNGNGKKIINWKSTLLNTLPYLKEKSSAKKENTGTPKPTTSKYSEL